MPGAVKRDLVEVHALAAGLMKQIVGEGIEERRFDARRLLLPGNAAKRAASGKFAVAEA
ncbi:MAG: hypothetical protein P8Y36_14280 [Alphaproteobacteria bacterium]